MPEAFLAGIEISVVGDKRLRVVDRQEVTSRTAGSTREVALHRVDLILRATAASASRTYSRCSEARSSRLSPHRTRNAFPSATPAKTMSLTQTQWSRDRSGTVADRGLVLQRARSWAAVAPTSASNARAKAKTHLPHRASSLRPVAECYSRAVASAPSFRHADSVDRDMSSDAVQLGARRVVQFLSRVVGDPRR